MDTKGSNILEGEAEESDEEISDYNGFMQNTMIVEKKVESKKSEQKPPQLDIPSTSVVVTGEAPEDSDEDAGDLSITRDIPLLSNQHLLGELDIRGMAEVDKPKVARRKFYSSFHKKLWESNFSLRLGIVQDRLDCFNDVVEKLNGLAPLATRTQNFAQEALVNYRMASELSKQLTDHVEAVLDQHILPELNDSAFSDHM